MENLKPPESNKEVPKSHVQQKPKAVLVEILSLVRNLHLRIDHVEKTMGQNFQDLLYIITSQKNFPLPSSSPSATLPFTNPETIPTPPVQLVEEDDYVLIGARPDCKIPTVTYKQYVDVARAMHTDRDRKLALSLLGYVFTPEELASQNATGKASVDGGRRKCVFPQLALDKMDALCRQVQLEFPNSKLQAGSTSCEIMQAINNLCRKRRIRYLQKISPSVCENVKNASEKHRF